MKKQRAMIIGSFVAIVTGTILACRSTSKLDTLEDEPGPIEKAKAYLPSVILIGGAFAVILKADVMSEAEITSLSAGYAFSQYLNSKWESEIKAILGNKETEVKERVYGSEVETMDLNQAKVIHIENGTSLFYDPLSKATFECSIDTMRRIEARIRDIVQNKGFMEVNDMYFQIGLPEVTDFKGLVFDEPPTFGYATFMMKTGEPCTVLIYKVSPKWWALSRRNEYTYNEDQNERSEKR